jgi:RimJ/RimL family protein N-acetyltransferase
MPGAEFLRGESMSLRTIEPEDHDFLHTYWNDPEIRYGAVRPTPLTEEDISGWVDPDAGVHFLACVDGTPVGTAILVDVFPQAGNGEIGYWIVPEEQGNGYATEAADLVVKHAFHDQGLHKVIARTFADNEASQRVLEKLGFEQEGRLRDHHYINGERKDMSLFGLTRPEWEARP